MILIFGDSKRQHKISETKCNKLTDHKYIMTEKVFIVL
jgi:hypothetical protein